MGTLVDMGNPVGDDVWVNALIVDNTTQFPINYNAANSSPVIVSGSGAPSGTVYLLPKGSLYINYTATTATTRLYVASSTASGSTAWAAITSAS